MKWNEVQYIDCMDENLGLPSLPDKEKGGEVISLTDPPWLYDYSKNKQKDRIFLGKRVLKAKNQHHYKDDYDNEWILGWFEELLRICNGVIIVMGQSKMIEWIQNTDPVGVLIIYHKNSSSQSKISKWNRFTPYLFYGKEYFKKHKIMGNVIEYVIPWGFLGKEKYIHPSQKGTEIPLKLFKDLKPTGIIDPFAGSGSYLKAAEILDIPWIGYEINPIYKQDIDKRFNQKGILKYT
jgi:hypothetical protein